MRLPENNKKPINPIIGILKEMNDAFSIFEFQGCIPFELTLTLLKDIHFLKSTTHEAMFSALLTEEKSVRSDGNTCQNLIPH
jgi:hypothetical protein